MWILTIMAILMGVLEIRCAYKSVEKDNKRIKRVFIMMGLSTILLGFILFILCYK
jgi:Na+-driven multidrug efflux pump